MSKTETVPALNMMQTAYAAEMRAIMPELVAAVDWSREQVKAEQRRKLRAMLTHAKTNSLWHAERLAKIDPATFTPDRMDEIPVMTKTDLNENFDAISTEGDVTRAWCENYLADGNPYSDGRYCITASGGSSGTRVLQVSKARAAAYWMGAGQRQLLRYAARTGSQIRMDAAWVMAAPGGAHATGVLGQLWQGAERGLRMAVTDPLDAIVERLNATRPRLLFVYSSFIRQLTQAQESGALDIAPEILVFTSETPCPADLEKAKQLWGCRLVSTWASVECNAIGASSMFEDGHLLHDDLSIIEAVDENNEPVPPDTECAKLLITALTSPVLPMIRYEVTDQVTIYSRSPVCGSALRAASWVNGRLDDHFTYDGGLRVHSHLFRHVLEQRPGIMEYQVRQKADGASVAIVPSTTFDTAEVKHLLHEGLVGIGLRQPHVEVTLVSAIERTSAQKLKQFVAL